MPVNVTVSNRITVSVVFVTPDIVVIFAGLNIGLVLGFGNLACKVE